MRAILSRYQLPVLSALALNLTFHPWCQERLVWVALVPLLVWLADPHLSTRHAFTGLLLVGATYHFVLLHPFLSLGWWAWGQTSVQDLRAYFTYAKVFMAVLVAAVSVWGGVVLGLIGLFLRPFLTRPLVSLLVVPSVWTVLLEYVGHRTVFSFGWGLIGNRLHGDEALRQVASVTGVYGLSFLVLMVNALVASWLIRLRTTAPGRLPGDEPALRPARRRATAELLTASAVAFLVLAEALGYGHRVLRDSPDSGEGLRVALLQGARAEYALDDFTPEGLDRLYSALLEETVLRGSELIVLPETIWLKTLQLDETTPEHPTTLMSTAQLHHALAGRLQGRRALIALGIDAVRGGRTYNATTFWNAEDGLIGVYTKRRLVPFAEYRPRLIGRWAPQNVLHGPRFAYTPGTDSQLVRVGPMTIGTFICQEVMFPGLVRQSVRDGAQLLVTTGNDGVFTNPIVAREQANLATLRAAENRRYLLRCMKTGISAVIDPYGRVIASGALNARTITSGVVHPRDGVSLYTRLGDWVVWVAGFVVALALGNRFRYNRHVVPPR